MKITIRPNWEKFEKERVQDLENLRNIKVLERAMIHEVTGKLKIPLRWTSKKAHLIVLVNPTGLDRLKWANHKIRRLRIEGRAV